MLGPGDVEGDALGAAGVEGEVLGTGVPDVLGTGEAEGDGEGDGWEWRQSCEALLVVGVLMNAPVGTTTPKSAAAATPVMIFRSLAMSRTVLSRLL